MLTLSGLLAMSGLLAASDVSALEPLVELDFGPRGYSDGTIILWGVGARDSRMGWTGGRVDDYIDRAQRRPELRDGIHGSDATFSIGISPPDSVYRLTILLGDQAHQPGSIRIHVNEKQVADGVTALIDQRRELQFLVTPRGDRVSFQLEAEACLKFAIVGARLEGPAGAELVAIFPEGDPLRGPIPPPDSLRTMDGARLQRQLRRDAEFLMSERFSDGRFSVQGAWYQNSFPIRTLLAADELLDEPKWRNAAFELLDSFVDGQLPDGNWHASYDEHGDCPDAPKDTTSANLADIGSMTLALALAAPLAEEPRRSRYRAALVRYADSISLPNQLPSGAFMNRTWQNTDYRFPYSVATATQVSMLVALHRLTGDERYRLAIEQAAVWLAKQVRDDGRITFAPHDKATTVVFGSTQFGEIYYMMEALMFVAGWTRDESLQRQVDRAFDRWVNGKEGLIRLASNGYWWPMKNLWSDSKLAGVPALLAERTRRPGATALPEIIRQQLSWLDEDPLSRRIGVRASPASQSGAYALAATGFAGLSAAAGLRFLPEMDVEPVSTFDPMSGVGPHADSPTDDTRLSLRPAAGYTVPELADTAYISVPNRRRKLPIHFDNAGIGPVVAKTVRIGAQWRAPGYAWFDGNVRDGFAKGVDDLLFASYAEGYDATMVVAVDPPDSLYTITVGLGDPENPRGPVSIVANDSLVAESIVTAAGERRTVTFRVRARAGRLAVRLISQSCAGFAVSDINYEGPDPSWLGFLFKPIPPMPHQVPEVNRLPLATPDTTRAILRRMANYLMDQQPRGGGWSSWGLWYQTAFAVRGILSAGIVLDEPTWREAAFAAIDRFAAEQFDRGSWSASYFGSDSCHVHVDRDTMTTNLADVGAMALVLALAADEAGGERRERWLAAARRYADAIILPEQLPDGAFPNRRWMGKDYLGPYSVATATQCSNLMVLGAVTGDDRYTIAAEKAAAWMAGTILEDGRVALYPHDSPNQKLLESTKFGEVFYIIEGLVWTRDLTSDTRLRQKCQAAVNRWLTGTNGIKSRTHQGYWWAPIDMWASSKMAGVPWILARDPRRGGQPIIDNWLDRSIGWMADPMRAQLIGIYAHPSSVRGEYALTATGFAAMGLASALDPGVLRPAAPRPAALKPVVR